MFSPIYKESIPMKYSCYYLFFSVNMKNHKQYLEFIWLIFKKLTMFMFTWRDLKCIYLSVKKCRKPIFFCTYPVNLNDQNCPLYTDFPSKYTATHRKCSKDHHSLQKIYIHIISSSSPPLLYISIYISF